MTNRGSPANLTLSLLAFGAFMILLLVAVAGFGIGTVELLIWLGLVILGVAAIVHRHHRARRGDSRPARAR